MKLSNFSVALVAILSAPCASAFGLGSSKCAFKLSTVAKRPLFGILDEVNSDAFDLSGNAVSKNPEGQSIDQAYDVFLAEIVFSTSDPRIIIVENYDRATDEGFLDWLNKKVENSKDPEEKNALRDLHGIIVDVKNKVELSKIAEEREAKEAEEAEAARIAEAEARSEDGRKMSDSEVLRKAAAVGTLKDAEADEAGSKKASFIDSELTPEIRASYESTLKKVLPPYKTGTTAATIAFTYYDQFDAQFVKILTEKANNGETDSKVLLEALAEEQKKRLSSATDSLKSVLSMGDPMRMEGAIVKLAREGKIDEPFLLLLEANASQAETQGATGPAQLMRKLKARAESEKDKLTTAKEVRLLRQLLRTKNPLEREQILSDAFTPKEALIVPGSMENARRAADGEAPEEEKPMPEVPPPDFIDACKAVMLNFGNLETDDDRGDLATQIKQIASEAEAVATNIYGKGMTAREQQDRMWKEQTASIWDLERMEMEAEQSGGRAFWTHENEDDQIIPGFDKDGKMRIGGG